MLRRTHLVTTSELVAMIAAICLWGAYAMAADGLTTYRARSAGKRRWTAVKRTSSRTLRPSVQPNSCIPF